MWNQSYEEKLISDSYLMLKSITNKKKCINAWKTHKIKYNIINKNKTLVLNTGDSRAYIYKKRKLIKRGNLWLKV